ncbi:MAG: ABC transporter ATP-binding protein [Clostridia bacterium]|nr:ABC transporter ATP-binding protein [Clostridia bacterium]
MIRFDHVSFGYPGHDILQDLSFQICPGTFTAVIGANGAGKSTLLRLIRGLLKPTAGEIYIEEKPLSGRKISTLAAGVGFLFQNPDRQICRNSMRDELEFSLASAGIPAAKREAMTAECLNAMDFAPDADPMRMSRGERQRAALASVLVTKPDLLLLDEPTTGLDYRECTHIMEYIREQNRKGVTVVMVCHDMELVLDYADRVLVLEQGGLLADGTPDAIFQNPDILRKASLLPPQLIGLAQRCGLDIPAADPISFADALEKEVRA